MLLSTTGTARTLKSGRGVEEGPVVGPGKRPWTATHAKTVHREAVSGTSPRASIGRGRKLSQRWLKVSSAPKPGPAAHMKLFGATHKVGTSVSGDTLTSKDLPDAMRIPIVESPVARTRPAWDYITGLPSWAAHRKMVQEDTAVSYDAPTWFRNTFCNDLRAPTIPHKALYVTDRDGRALTVCAPMYEEVEGSGARRKVETGRKHTFTHNRVYGVGRKAEELDPAYVEDGSIVSSKPLTWQPQRRGIPKTFRRVPGVLLPSEPAVKDIDRPRVTRADFLEKGMERVWEAKRAEQERTGASKPLRSYVPFATTGLRHDAYHGRDLAPTVPIIDSSNPKGFRTTVDVLDFTSHAPSSSSSSSHRRPSTATPSSTRRHEQAGRLPQLHPTTTTSSSSSHSSSSRMSGARGGGRGSRRYKMRPNPKKSFIPGQRSAIRSRPSTARPMAVATSRKIRGRGERGV